MIYELQIYHIYPGKMAAINQRFQDHTISLFEKHGMQVVDFWQDASENRIYYTMEHASQEDRDQRFAAFAKDPEWMRVRSESEKNGPIVEKVDSYMMKRVSYSPMNKA